MAIDPVTAALGDELPKNGQMNGQRMDNRLTKCAPSTANQDG